MMKNKFFVTAGLMFAVVLASSQNAMKLTVAVDGKPVEWKQGRPATVVGRVMVPMRDIFEAVGAMVEWNGVDHKITARRNNEIIECRIGDKLAKKNGAEIMLDSAPTIHGATTLVPLRFVAEGLGAKVNFDKPNNHVEVMLKG